MSLENSFVEVATHQAPKQAGLVNNLIEDAPILESLPVMPASHDISNVFEELLAVVGAITSEMDAPLADVSVDTKLQQKDLTPIRGLLEVGIDKAQRFGGPAEYFASKLPSVLAATGADIERSLITDVLRPAALATTNIFDAEGDTADKQNSIIAVRWSGGNAGLYSPKMFGDGKLLETLPVNRQKPAIQDDCSK